MIEEDTETELYRTLCRLVFPAYRDDLVNQAAQYHAPEDVLDLLRGLPDREYVDVPGVLAGLDPAR
ncbi:MAG: DUF2795 domain-containing protein [Mycobacteriales bacterium]